VSKADLARQLAREGKLNAKQICERCGFKDVYCVQRACQEVGIDVLEAPPVPQSRTTEVVKVWRRFSKSSGKKFSSAFIGVRILRGAGLDKETRLAANVVGNTIVISARKP
jgi:hypothetical protein